GERGLGDQIARYRTAFISVIAMVVIALFVGGYILSNERLSLPGWVPVLGKEYVTLKAHFRTAQAVTPGQGQAVTIAGAKIGEIASVQSDEGDALVTMNITPKYAHYIYRDATMLLRPKTGLKDMTVEVDPGTPKAGHVPNGYTVPQSQTAPDVNFEEFLASLDGETRAYLQELIAGAGQGLKGNSANLSATFKRFDPISLYTRKITAQLQLRHKNIERAVHNFQLIISALGNKDTEISQAIDASNAVFKTFAEQDQNFQHTLALLPSTLSKTKSGLGKLARTSAVVGPTLTKLEPFANALAPAQVASRSLFKTSTPIIKNEIRPFARKILPVIDQLNPSLTEIAEAFPGLEKSFAVFNEFFNELAYNPGPNQGGFLFFLDWANHDLNSTLSTADAHGPLGRTVAYLNCELLPLLTGVSEINATVKLLVALFNPPSAAECQSLGLVSGTATTASSGKASAHVRTHSAPKGFTLKLLGSKHSAFGRIAATSGGGR
ncbi:MAG TPA: MlaD family protein, partial [Solirubrobacteraceae bacterium]|nr:MlaD family protein [Solirubrobacteraceae bacterium]